jgi:hypothetical protein
MGGVKMPYNYSSLSGKIVEKFGTQYRFAEAMGLSEHTISQKLNKKQQWKQNEILKACELLEIRKEEIPKYFFAM